MPPARTDSVQADLSLYCARWVDKFNQGVQRENWFLRIKTPTTEVAVPIISVSTVQQLKRSGVPVELDQASH